MVDLVIPKVGYEYGAEQQVNLVQEDKDHCRIEEGHGSNGGGEESFRTNSQPRSHATLV